MGITIEGKYALVESENFDEYLKSCGVNFVVRAIAKKFKPVLDIYRDEEDETYWIWKSVTPIKTIIIRFRFNEPFEMEFPDGSGRKLQVVGKQEGNKITMHQQLDGRTITDEKEFDEDGMITRLTHGNIVSVRKYKKVKK